MHHRHTTCVYTLLKWCLVITTGNRRKVEDPKIYQHSNLYLQVLSCSILLFFQQAWKWKMDPLETKLIFQGPISHFHDYGRKGNLLYLSKLKPMLSAQKFLTGLRNWSQIFPIFAPTIFSRIFTPDVAISPANTGGFASQHHTCQVCRMGADASGDQQNLVYMCVYLTRLTV